MLTEQNIKTISKFLSMVLRHQPEFIGIKMDEAGWVEVQELLLKSSAKGVQIDIEILKIVVQNNDKQRFSFNEDQTKIRASQGHSVAVDLGYTPQNPPDVLFHGTTIEVLPKILKEGLKRMARHHVHLSKDKETAIKVGSRRGNPLILKINAFKMKNAGHQFFLSDNGVWLTEEVPPQFLEVSN
jgi:putative RNA 2'-phosphotransferase